MRAGIVSFLKNTEIKILAEAENGEELLKILRTKRPEIILLDLEMPKLNGSKTLNKLRKEFASIKVIILSKYHDENLIKDVFNRGASAFVSKANTNVDVLTSAIRRVALYGVYKDNIPCLLRTPADKDGHYYRLILSQREVEVLGLLYQSKSYEEIGKELFISPNTVENHAKSIYRKTNAKNRTEFGIIATRLGLNYIGGIH